jgi:hypothetical protein
MKHTLSLDKMLEETKVLREEKKQDHKVWEAALVEVKTRGLNPQDNRDLLVELRERLGEVEADHVTEAEELASLMTNISKVLMDLGLSPIQGIPQVRNKAREVLKVTGSILERLREVPTSSVVARP